MRLLLLRDNVKLAIVLGKSCRRFLEGWVDENDIVARSD